MDGGLSVAEFWALPVHHMLFQFFKPIEAEDVDDAHFEDIRRQNRTTARPYIPAWALADCARRLSWRR